jgi:hypothetical protein
MFWNIYARVMKWLARRGRLREDEGPNARAERSPAEALTALGMQRGTPAFALGRIRGLRDGETFSRR